jgi:hypothetical protein
MSRIGLFGALLASTTLLAGASQASFDKEAAPLRILFIGNSFTKSNDLPATVARVAAASGRHELQYRTVAYSGFRLGNHWTLGTARTALESGDWDVVVMQDVPSSLPEDQEYLRTWTSRFADLARAADTRPALLTVWPSLERRSTLPDVIASHRLAAQAAGADLIPAAEAVQAAWRCGLHRSVYSRDLVHPSPLGTYVAALIVYGALYGAPVRSRRLYPVGESPRTARLLQAAAATALGRQLPTGSRCG